MITVKNSGHRAVAATTPEGIKVIRPGKSETFDREPINVEALKGVNGVKVSGKAEAPAPEPQPQPSAAASAAASPAAPAAPAAGGKAPAKGVQPPSAPPSGGTA